VALASGVSRAVQSKRRMRSEDSRLTITYLAGLIGVALISLVAAGIFWRALGQHSADARLLNLAGRQRMLSQRISKIALELRGPESGVDAGQAGTFRLRFHLRGANERPRGGSQQ
jgi:Type IV pili methyl-accepting chemotaxis transducer N-term